ncbi:HTH domain-containing protein [Nocardia abscessus]|uniref:helix-turn-helix transcriptional regulator n=1 Tax=Nocardia abscessus TaxID=120957 RepID=UPI0018932554|nr:WYL domain-containing protein [Nocardia abscessus]MBF6339671.1 HTH domain-containing protein [Nocardia abscessus]
MANTSHRALRLLSLLGSGRQWPLRELATRLGVSERTVRRDIETLRQLDYPITTIHGPDGGYRLGAGHTLPPLLFDHDHALAVAVALQTAPSTMFGLGDDAARALATLHQVMPPALRASMESLRLTRLQNYWEFSAPPIDPAALTAVGTAVCYRRLLVTETLRPDGTRPEPGDPDFLPAHRIEPHHLVVWAARWYLVAYDLTDHEWRVHRVDRLNPRPTQHFSARALPDDDLAHFVMSTHNRGDTPADWQCTGTVVMVEFVPELGIPVVEAMYWHPLHDHRPCQHLAAELHPAGLPRRARRRPSSDASDLHTTRTAAVTRPRPRSTPARSAVVR